MPTYRLCLVSQLVFVYVTAEYETKLNSLNQIVLWDYIIEDIAVSCTLDLTVFLNYPN